MQGVYVLEIAKVPMGEEYHYEFHSAFLDKAALRKGMVELFNNEIFRWIQSHDHNFAISCSNEIKDGEDSLKVVNKVLQYLEKRGVPRPDIRYRFVEVFE